MPTTLPRMPTEINADALRWAVIPGALDRAQATNAAIRQLLEMLDSQSTDPSSLSPADILTMAEHFLNGMDAQIKTVMGDLQRNNNATERLRRAIEVIQSRMNTAAPGDDTVVLSASLNDKIDPSDPESPTIGQVLREVGVQLQGSGPDGAFRRRDINGLLEAIRGRMEDIRQKSEIVQMNLQQLMSRRGQFVQMLSNVMQSMNETTKAIVQNTRG